MLTVEQKLERMGLHLKHPRVASCIGNLFVYAHFKILYTNLAELPFMYTNASVYTRTDANGTIKAEGCTNICRKILTLESQDDGVVIKTVDAQWALNFKKIVVVITGHHKVLRGPNPESQPKKQFMHSFLISPEKLYGFTSWVILNEMKVYLDEELWKGPDIAVEESALEYDDLKENVVVVPNLPEGADNSFLQALFSVFGPITSENINILHNQVGERYATIQFETRTAAHKAIKSSPVQTNQGQLFVKPNKKI